MKPGVCLATFRTGREYLSLMGGELWQEDTRDHRCFLPAGHMDTAPHRCICVDRLLTGYGPDYYDRQGKPIPMCAWSVLFEDREGYGRVRSTYVGPWWISTIWLGLDHGFNFKKRPDYRPMIFETMVFWHGPEGGERRYEDGERYSTEAEARRGHARFVREARRLLRAMPKFPDGVESQYLRE